MLGSLSGRTGFGVKVAVIDSGILLDHPDFSDADICALSIEKILDSYECVPQKTPDSFGHGTACAWIIHKKAPQAKIISIQALDNNGVGDFDKILFALQWCVSNKIDIINLSFGSTSKKHYKAFYDVGKQAAQSNILIFAATHDYSLTSVPASVDNYIGVYRTSKADKETYIWSEQFHRAGAYGRKQRVGWPLCPYYIMMEGCSLATAHMSGTGALIRELHPKENYEAYLSHMCDYAVNQETNVSNLADKAIINSNNASLFSIGKATIYGYTKEMHSLLKYGDLSNIEICEIVDHKRTTNIGKEIEYGERRITIKTMEQLAELKSDTLIISKLSKFNELIQEDTLKSAIEYGIRNNQNIYSLEYVDSTMYPDLYALAKKYDLKIRHPLITDENLSYAKSIREMYGHYGVDIPVVGIFGTGTSQGKFTLQLELRRLLSSVGYKVKNLGTEMHSELFGFESYYPMEILRSIQFSQWDMIEFLQGEIRRLEIENPTPDIIIAGSQSGTIPKTYAIDSSIFTLPSIAFLMGTIPHAYILAVNSQDDDQYILDTIAAMQAIGKGKVICIVFSRLMRTAQNDCLLTQKDICLVKTRLEQLTSLPVVEIGSAEGQKNIVDIIVNYFL